MEKKDKEVCDKCYECYWYWENNDTEDECNGQKEACYEFIKSRNQTEYQRAIKTSDKR